MQLQQAVEPTELALLTTEWRAAPQQHFELAVDHPFLSGQHQLLVSNGRRAEICYVMHRGVPAEGVLLHIKTMYPSGAYRLPTGGIQSGEPVLATLTREIYEETGLKVGPGADQVQVQRWLGVLSYAMAHRTLVRTFEFATYIFLAQMPAAATLNPTDPEEQIADWQWRTPAELHTVAQTLATIGVQVPGWADWGRYRALVHTFVADRLASPSVA